MCWELGQTNYSRNGSFVDEARRRAAVGPAGTSGAFVLPTTTAADGTERALLAVLKGADRAKRGGSGGGFGFDALVT